jgi:hypothetical protein
VSQEKTFVTGMLPDEMNPVLSSERRNSRITLRSVFEFIRVQDDRAVKKRAALRHSFVNASNSKLNEK